MKIIIRVSRRLHCRDFYWEIYLANEYRGRRFLASYRIRPNRAKRDIHMGMCVSISPHTQVSVCIECPP